LAKFAPVYMSVYDGVTFVDLELDALTLVDDDAEDTLIGEISGQDASSTLSVQVGGDKVKISGSNLVVGSEASVAGSLEITIRESNPNGEGLYRDTDFTLTVTT